MAYGEYKNSGRCPGKCLYQLSQLGVPVHILGDVIFSNPGEITYRGKPFATHKWNEKDTPIFTFAQEWKTFNSFEQDPIFTVFESRDFGVTYSEIISFSFENPLEEYRWLMGHRHRIFNKNGEVVGRDLKPIIKPVTTIEDKVAQLIGKFH